MLCTGLRNVEKCSREIKYSHSPGRSSNLKRQAVLGDKIFSNHKKTWENDVLCSFIPLFPIYTSSSVPSRAPPLTLALVFISCNCCYSFNILFIICFHILATRSQGFTHQLWDFSTYMLQNLKLLNNSKISETPNTLSIEKGKNSLHNLTGSNTAPPTTPFTLAYPLVFPSILNLLWYFT